MQLNYEVCFKRTISFITFCVMSVFSVFLVGDKAKEIIYFLVIKMRNKNGTIIHSIYLIRQFLRILFVLFYLLTLC